MKTTLVVMLALLLSACIDSNVWAFQIERANAICAAQGGLKYIGDATRVNNQTYLNGKCNSGLEFSQTFATPVEVVNK